VGVCNQVAFLILNYITSRLVPLLKVIDAPIQVPNILDLTVSFEFLNLTLIYYKIYIDVHLLVLLHKCRKITSVSKFKIFVSFGNGMKCSEVLKLWYFTDY